MSLKCAGGNEKGTWQTTDFSGLTALFTHPAFGSDMEVGRRTRGLRQAMENIAASGMECGLRIAGAVGGSGGGLGRKQAATICSGRGLSPACPAGFPSFDQEDCAPHLLLKTFDFASKQKL